MIALAQGLLNPSLTLYAFHLRTDISRGVEQAASDAEQMWQQLIALGKALQIPELQDLQQKLLCYQAGQYQPSAENKLPPGQQSLLSEGEDGIDFQMSSQFNTQRINLSGFLCPFRLHDAYAIDLTLSYKGTLSVEQLEQLNPQGYLLPPRIQGSLGQTLLLYAETTPGKSHENHRALADACISNLVHSKQTPDLIATGDFLGIKVFEYDTQAHDPIQQCHILIWLNCFGETSEQMGKDFDFLEGVTEQLLYLLYFRHKIVYAYDQSRWCNEQALKKYSELEQHIKDFPETAQRSDRLQIFRNLLTKLPTIAFDYSRYLRDLDDHETTIATNARNYELKLSALKEQVAVNTQKYQLYLQDSPLSKALPEPDLPFLQSFLDLTQNKYAAQIQVDRRYLVPGADLTQRLMDTVRGLVEIEQTEIDRQLQEQLRQQDEESQRRETRLQLAIAFFGIGFAVSGISSQVNPTPVEALFGQPLPNETNPCPTSAIALNVLDVLIHVGIGLLAGSVAALFVMLWQRRQSNHSS